MDARAEQSQVCLQARGHWFEPSCAPVFAVQSRHAIVAKKKWSREIVYAVTSLTATLRARQLTGRAAWAPLFVLAGGLVAVPFYSFDKVVHFILLGLLWGSAWLHMALVGHRQAVATADLRGRRRRVGQQSAPAPVAARDVVQRPVAHDVRCDVWRDRHRHHHGRDLTS
jgi:hypothetical protein